ncbi:hypothetical protein J6590_027924 [Homalodisca vitripennis]|nr:hypothetical protein J6590_027924 [Homalodisca vitripennis]
MTDSFMFNPSTPGERCIIHAHAMRCIADGRYRSAASSSGLRRHGHVLYRDYFIGVIRSPNHCKSR